MKYNDGANKNEKISIIIITILKIHGEGKSRNGLEKN